MTCVCVSVFLYVYLSVCKTKQNEMCVKKKDLEMWVTVTWLSVSVSVCLYLCPCVCICVYACVCIYICNEMGIKKKRLGDADDGDCSTRSTTGCSLLTLLTNSRYSRCPTYSRTHATDTTQPTHAPPKLN